MSNSVHARLGISAQAVDKQTPEDRVRNWEEVYQGYDLSQAIIEAARCIHCPTAPCQTACPTHNDISGALSLIEQGEVAGAAALFRRTSTMPEMCGRLCPQERLCEGVCPVGFALRPGFHDEPPVSIGKLEAFAADFQRQKLGGFPLPLELADPSGKRVAVVGSGPSGLTVAEELAVKGHEVTVYEQWPEPGGPLRHGIPNFKLAKDILNDKLRHLTLLGVDFVCNTRAGRDITIDELMRDFDAVYLGIGAGTDAAANLPGEELRGIVSATDFLVRANAQRRQLLPSPDGERAGSSTAIGPLAQGPRVVVLGGTDAAMDAMRAALRIGASSVTCLFEGTREEIHGRREEHNHAREEGVVFRLRTKPLGFSGDAQGRVTGVQCRRLGWNYEGQRDAFGMAETEFVVPADLVIIGIGYVPDPLLTDATPGLTAGENARLVVDRETGRTSRPGIFAGGDGVHGPDLVVTAMAAGRRAAAAIDEYLRTQLPKQPTTATAQRLPAPTEGARPKRRPKWFSGART